MSGFRCEECGLLWGGEGSHPPCLELPSEERRALYDQIRQAQRDSSELRKSSVR